MTRTGLVLAFIAGQAVAFGAAFEKDQIAAIGGNGPTGRAKENVKIVSYDEITQRVKVMRGNGETLEVDRDKLRVPNFQVGEYETEKGKVESTLKKLHVTAKFLRDSEKLEELKLYNLISTEQFRNGAKADLNGRKVNVVNVFYREAKVGSETFYMTKDFKDPTQPNGKLLVPQYLLDKKFPSPALPNSPAPQAPKPFQDDKESPPTVTRLPVTEEEKPVNEAINRVRNEVENLKPNKDLKTWANSQYSGIFVPPNFEKSEFHGKLLAAVKLETKKYGQFKKMSKEGIQKRLNSILSKTKQAPDSAEDTLLLEIAFMKLEREQSKEKPSRISNLISRIQTKLKNLGNKTHGEDKVADQPIKPMDPKHDIYSNPSESGAASEATK